MSHKSNQSDQTDRKIAKIESQLTDNLRQMDQALQLMQTALPAICVNLTELLQVTND